MSTKTRERKAFAFDIKEVSDAGTFTGYASVYNTVDLGRDRVRPGAFSKTLSERGREVPLLWQHDQHAPIGSGILTDTATGLQIEGRLCLGTTKGREAHELLKHGKALGGISIGYDTVKQSHKDGVRDLLELRLYECSLVTFPMNEEALVTTVKSTDVPFDWKAIGVTTETSHITIVVGEKSFDSTVTWQDDSPMFGPPTEIETKAGARHSRADLDKLQAMHDHCIDLGAKCHEPKAHDSVTATQAADLALADPDLDFVQSLRARNDVWRRAATRSAVHGNAGHQTDCS